MIERSRADPFSQVQRSMALRLPISPSATAHYGSPAREVAPLMARVVRYEGVAEGDYLTAAGLKPG